MGLSEKFAVPREIALLSDFATSIDLRRYMEQGVTHAPGDELATMAQLNAWLRARGLLDEGVRLDAEDHRNALELREALRAFLQLARAERAGSGGAAERLNAAAAHFPLTLEVSAAGDTALRPARDQPSSGLGNV